MAQCTHRARYGSGECIGSIRKKWSRGRELNPRPTDYEADQNTRFDADLRYNPASVFPETRLNRGHLSHRRPLVPINAG